MKAPYILTTGDVVLDIAVYQGNVEAPGDPGEIKPWSMTRQGGARQLHEIIEQAVGKQSAQFGLAGRDGAGKGRTHPKTYTLWRPSPSGKKNDSGDTVWRVAQALGYDLPGGANSEPPLRRANVESDRGCPTVLVIDDAGLGFRTVRAKDRWPACLQTSERGPSEHPAVVILKMSQPLAQGDLWRALTSPADSQATACGLRNNLVVVTSINELRRAGAAISRGFSWERTLTELSAELERNPSFSPLLRCSRHLIINFGCDGAIWFNNECVNSANGAPASAQHCAKLIYDPALADGQWPSTLASKDKVYGHLNTFTAAVAIGLFNACNAADQEQTAKVDGAIAKGIECGLNAVRCLREHGHGLTKTAPRFPDRELKPVLLGAKSDASHFSSITIPETVNIVTDPQWTLAALAENMAAGNNANSLPLYGLAHRITLYGLASLGSLPRSRFGSLVSIDRYEMETLRGLQQRIDSYAGLKKAKQPLCLGAFGPPGAGKSFGIKQIAAEVLGEKVPILEFNLSQFDSPGMLIGAFHQVRDAVLKGSIPVVFWDEFDCNEYDWLQYLLAPMQDGAFQEAGHTHTLGKCIFVFAGGTSWDFEHFGPAPMPEGWRDVYAQSGAALDELSPDADAHAISDLQSYYSPHSDRAKSDAEANKRFRLKKGPDFLSRLDAHINVLGPNRRRLYNWSTRQWDIDDPRDITFPVRRALLLRSFLGAKKDRDGLRMDRDLLRALLHMTRYVHGARSLEKVVTPLVGTPQPFHRAYLPPAQVLSQHLGSANTLDAVNSCCVDFLASENLRRIAAAIDENYNRLTALQDKSNRKALKEEEFLAAFDATPDPWNKATNLAAAQRLPDVLALASLSLERSDDSPYDASAVKEHLRNHLDILAEEEHRLWMQFHLDNGWQGVAADHFDGLDKEARKKEIGRLKREERRHWLLVPFNKLPDDQKTKDHDAILHYPDMAELVGWKIVFAK